MKRIVLIAVLITAAFSICSAQFRSATIKEIHFDAVGFKSDLDSLSRIDIYIMVPYEVLSFQKSGDKYAADYDLTVTVKDSSGKKVKDIYKSKSAVADSYFSTKGGSAGFDLSQYSVKLTPGRYDVEVFVTDNYSKLSLDKRRNVSVVDYSKFKYSTSGILLLSSVEENEGKYKITPHITDNISDIKNSLYAFFEIYQDGSKESANVYWEVLNSKGASVLKSNPANINITGNKRSGHFLKIDIPQNFDQGVYTLRIFSLNPFTSEIISISERVITNRNSTYATLFADIRAAVKKLRYAATRDEIDLILADTSEDGIKKRFDEFWKKHDPTPGTDRNEALEEYYSRIERADKIYSSSREGWMSDKGHVFVVYGPPTNIETSKASSYGTVYERWIYAGRNLEFVFADNNGFGDFKLYSPSIVTELYKYAGE